MEAVAKRQTRKRQGLPLALNPWATFR